MTDSSPIQLTASRQLTSWLIQYNVALAFTTYQTGKLFLIGVGDEGRLSIFERTFNRCLGLWSNGQMMWMSTLFQLWRFENVLLEGQTADGYDRLYVPRMSLVTGDLDIHDIGVDAAGQPVFVNTLFSCLARPSSEYSFVTEWTPPFITRLAAEDRCHLNGLAMRDGTPRYVTAIDTSDVADGWRAHRVDGGCVLDVVSSDVVCSELAMPHSPRWHNGQLWLLESGSGQLGTVSLQTGQFHPVAFCPGYARGLTFVDRFAVVGLSSCRENRTFQDLPLNDQLASRKATARCGLIIIDLVSGDLVHWLWIEGLVRELYDVVTLPGVRRPMALGFKTDEIRRTLSIAPND